MEQLIRFLPIIFRLINIAPQIQEAIRTGVPTVKAVEENARDLLPILAQVGKQLFPEVDDKFAPAAAATAMFDPVRAKWLQTALNMLGTDPPLDVDGEYGPHDPGGREAVPGDARARRRRLGRRRHTRRAPACALQDEIDSRRRGSHDARR